jgi:adenosylcobinamide amidohydrolase
MIVRFDAPFRTLGWASWRGAFARARVVANHQVLINDRAATEAPRQHLRGVLRSLAIDPRAAVAMMTGANVNRAAYASARRAALIAGAWCTAGCSNALRAGDRATFESTRPGTINLIVALNEPLEDSAMAEAIQIATEARVLAVQETGVMSTRSGRPATGTGTDCIVIAAPIGPRPHRHCGKHTLAGELIARAAHRACARALAAA